MPHLSRWTVIGLLLGLPVFLLVFLRINGGIDLAYQSAQMHLIVVGGIAACASLVAVAAVFATVRTGQGNVVFVGIGCLAVGVLMLAHGLTTPGILGNEFNLWTGRLPKFALGSFVVGLSIASWRPTSRLHRFAARRPLLTVLVPTTATVCAAAWIVADPTHLAGTTPIAHELTITRVVVVLIGLGALRATIVHWKRWQLGHDVVQFALMLAAGMTLAAATANQFGQYPRISWWDYHAYLLAGFGGAVQAVYLKFRRTQDVARALDGAFADDPFEHIVRGYPEALRALVQAVEVKDAYTHGHSARTAELAVELGIAMGLSADRLRTVARGGYLHDIGKIAIPDEILNKPGRLTDDERRVIETHPALGYEMAASASSLHEALDVILCHHERFDGTGYPAGIAGREIPLEARVVAVADVWDALTTDRAYRPGWEPSRALAHIVAGSGSQFDPTVVRALVTVIGTLGINLDDEPGDSGEAWEAAQTCHQVDRAVPATAG